MNDAGEVLETVRKRLSYKIDQQKLMFSLNHSWYRHSDGTNFDISFI